MTYLLALSITTGLLCGAWMEISNFFGLIAWAGFAGCTTFFAAGGGKSGVKDALATNLSGVFWAVVTMGLTNLIGLPHAGTFSTIIITAIMCLQSKCKWLKFIPGAFVGSFSTFAAGGNWQGVAISLICGACLGYACEVSGKWLFKVTNSAKTEKLEKAAKSCVLE